MLIALGRYVFFVCLFFQSVFEQTNKIDKEKNDQKAKILHVKLRSIEFADIAEIRCSRLIDSQ